jgi:hypothetical protein
MGWSARALAHQHLEDFGAGRRRYIWGMSDVRSGSWLCENAKTLNRDRRSYSSKTVLVAQSASGFNLEIELKNIILRRVSIFEVKLGSGEPFAMSPLYPRYCCKSLFRVKIENSKGR